MKSRPIARWFGIIVLCLLVIAARVQAQDTTNGIIWYPKIQVSDSTLWSNLPSIARSGDDTIHLTWHGGTTRLAYARSVDGGLSFEPVREMLPDSSITAPFANGPKVAAYDQNVYLCYTNSEPSDDERKIRLFQSTDGGTTFGSVRAIGPDTCAYVEQAVALSADVGIVYAPIDGTRRLLRSSDAGSTWSRSSQILDEYSRIALSPGFLHHVKTAYYNNASEIVYQRSTNLGWTWETETVLSTMEGYFSDYPAVASQQTECGTEVNVVWRDVKYGVIGFGGASILNRISLDGGKQWLAERALTSIPNGLRAQPSLKGGVRATSWWSEAVPFDTSRVAVRGSDNSLFSLSPEFDVTPNVYTGSPPTIAASAHAIHVAWEEEQGSTFRIFYRRGEFIPSSPAISISAGLLEYDSTEINESRGDSVTVTNIGSDPLTIGTALSLTEDFLVIPESTTIQAGAAKTFSVHFTPKTAGDHTGKVLLYHNGGSSPDCFTVHGVGVYSRQSVAFEPNAWNLVSTPLRDGPAQTLPNLHFYDTGYQNEDTIRFGVGYWAKPGAAELEFLGAVTTVDTVELAKGWNLIGSVSIPVPVLSVQTQPDSLFNSPFYGYSNAGYVEADTIQSGKSYWVKAKENGQMILKE